MSGLLIQFGTTSQVFHRAFTAGRVGADLLIADEYASPQHVQFTPDGDGWVAADLGSMNGMWVNGERAYKHRLAKGDRVRVGRTTMTVVPL